MHFDPTISFGNILTIAGIVVAWYSLQFNQSNRVQDMHTRNESRLTNIESTMSSVNSRLGKIEDWLFRKLN